MMIGISGQLDGIAALFSHALARHDPSHTRVAMGREASCGWNVQKWRLGSMTSERDTRNMLQGVDTVFYFCLTPPYDGRTHEGNGYDVALCDAMNFAHVAADKVRVVLITRMFPNDGRPLGQAFSYWREVTDIFTENIQNLQIVRTTPIWSEHDALMTGMYHYATNHRFSYQDVRFFNYIDPVTMGELIRKLVSISHDETISWEKQPTWELEGETAVSYQALLHCMKSCSHTSRRLEKTLTDIIRKPHPLSFHEDQLFLEAVEFHSATEQTVRRDSQTTRTDLVFQACRDFVHEYNDTSLLNAAYTRLGTAARDERIKTAHEVATNSRNYVYKIAKEPRRSVEEIAELFVQWLPRYFQRTMSLEKINETRQMCRISRIPLAEFELEKESWKRCRLHMKWPWGVRVNGNTKLVVTVTGTRDNPRELLLVCEDGPDSSWFIMLARSIMAAFGRYLRDYGVAR